MIEVAVIFLLAFNLITTVDTNEKITQHLKQEKMVVIYKEKQDEISNPLILKYTEKGTIECN